ncbi:MAG: Gfo/Idh/MocA family oxidoreductase [Gemmatimonadaceae bacterium]|nr:Gfo/Idh/MocA family oxidoreductase [Chitinophagaceae bacterium]
MDTFKWGIIGPGKIANDFTKDLEFASSPHKVTTIYSRNREKGEEFASKYDIANVYTSMEEFIEKADVDAVYIATPHTLHREEALACLRKKIPVLCEKPIAINADQMNELMASSTENETFLMEGMWTRFLPSIELVTKMVEQGTIGDIVAIKASMSYKAPYDPNSRYFNPDLGGGSLLDLGIYPVFLAMFFLGKPAEIKSFAKISDKGIDETCAILLNYSNGQYAMLDSSIITQMESLAEIIGDKGIIKILAPWTEKPAGIEVNLYNGTKMAYPCEWEGHGFQFEVDEVARCVRNNQSYSNLLPQHFSLDMLETMDEIRSQIHVVYEKYE